jgi:UTP--glucose-1-phosphate uridylyltransferase
MPTIAHIVCEFAAAGIRRVVLVVAEQYADVMRALFDPSSPPPKRVANDPQVLQFESVLRDVELIFMTQSGNYGNATPLVIAAQHVRGAPCVYAFGDDVIFGENATQGLIRCYASTGRPVLGAQEVEPAKKSSFGIVEASREDGIYFIDRLIEKPRPDETPSNLAAFGRYLVTPDLLDTLLATPTGRDGELWFVDAVIQQLKQGKRVCAFPLTTGTWYTVGDPDSYVRAVQAAMDALRTAPAALPAPVE